MGTAVLVILAIGYIIFNATEQNKDCQSTTDQNAKNDCYHALAHSMNNMTLCNNIADVEEKEHCREHVPE